MVNALQIQSSSTCSIATEVLILRREKKEITVLIRVTSEKSKMNEEGQAFGVSCINKNAVNC